MHHKRLTSQEKYVFSSGKFEACHESSFWVKEAPGSPTVVTDGADPSPVAPAVELLLAALLLTGSTGGMLSLSPS